MRCKCSVGPHMENEIWRSAIYPGFDVLLIKKAISAGFDLDSAEVF